ncbi:MAG: lysophospholipid acyltransferase family protein [Bacteroidales bacterium]|jgi:KDO2-lipid IV(A) lauroyltransferase|nr:lysophospholipid acyltransferase family protein [Bacteroidales bacterium]
MDALGYYIFYAFYRLITLLPLRVLYILSDFLFLCLCYFPTYRRKIVETNLRNSFPDKSEHELKKIRNGYYRHMADIIVESLKAGTMSRAELEERITYSGFETVDRIFEEKRDVVAVLGHYNNWEMALMLGQHIRHKAIAIYRPLKNVHFDRIINKTRSKYGIVLSPMSMVLKEILKSRSNNINTLTLFLSDQTPPKHEIKFWTRFLNQDTPVFTGAEKIAAKYDMAVVFLNISKIKRGYYNISIELLFDHSAGLPEHAITEAHVRRLEEIIKENPEYWLWSHRRWKHKKPAADA